MQTDKEPNKNTQIPRNPSRGNTNIKQGQENEKNVAGEKQDKSDVEVNPGKQVDRNEIDLDRSGVNTASSRENDRSGDRSKNRPTERSSKQPDGQTEIQQEEQQAGQTNNSGEPAGVKNAREHMGSPQSGESGATSKGKIPGQNAGPDKNKIAGDRSMNMNENERTSGTYPGSTTGQNQNANRGAQSGGAFHQDQDDSRRI